MSPHPCGTPRSVGWLLLALGCQATTTRPPFAPLPEAAVTRLHLPIGRATRILADSLGADSVPIRRVEERDGYFESRWYSVPEFTVGRGPPLGSGMVRVRGWVDPGPVSGADTVSIITVEAAYRAFEDPSRDDRELERHVEASHVAWQRIQAVLKVLVTTFGDPEEPAADSAAARPPAGPPVRPDTTGLSARPPARL
jgi:hypothetical protein